MSYKKVRKNISTGEEEEVSDVEYSIELMQKLIELLQTNIVLLQNIKDAIDKIGKKVGAY